MVEAGLRAELCVATKEKNDALQSAQKFQAKYTLLSEQLQQTRNKLARATHEKIQMERAQRGSLSLAKSTEPNNSSSSSFSSLDYSNVRIKGLETETKTLKEVLNAKNIRLAELQRQIDLGGLRGDK